MEFPFFKSGPFWCVLSIVIGGDSVVTHFICTNLYGVTLNMSLFNCRISTVTFHISHVTYHSLHATIHFLHVIFQTSHGTYISHELFR